MALTKRTEFGSRNVLADGQIQVRVDTVIEEDGKEVARTYHRRVLAPGDDVSAQPADITRLTTIEWTPAVIAAFQAARLAAEARIRR